MIFNFLVFIYLTYVLSRDCRYRSVSIGRISDICQLILTINEVSFTTWHLFQWSLVHDVTCNLRESIWRPISFFIVYHELMPCVVNIRVETFRVDKTTLAHGIRKLCTLAKLGDFLADFLGSKLYRDSKLASLPILPSHAG